MIATGLQGIQYNLDANRLSDGGEGEIFRVLGGTNKVAKIYKPGIPSRELEEKLKFMKGNPPGTTILNQVAWPLDIIYRNNQFCGFVMPELKINAELGDIYKYPSKSNISTKYKLIIAQNICVVISEVHKLGYVFGDFNPRNIAIDIHNGHVAFLDTDSYHVIINQNKVYRCNVCAPGYSAPELLEKCSNHVQAHPGDSKNAYAKTPLPTFTRETDNFSLAIHIFKLLMNGYTPYGGILDSESVSQASPGTGDTPVRRDNYCFKQGYKPQSAAIPPLDSFSQAIAELFTRAFVNGKADPRQRPTAIEWYKALVAYENNLVQCKNNILHQYDRKNKSCPLCEADEKYALATGTIQQRIAVPLQPPSSTYSVSFYSIGKGNLTAMVNGISITSAYTGKYGEDVVFIATPNYGYRVKQWTNNKSNIYGNKTNSYSFSITASADISVEFEEETYIFSYDSDKFEAFLSGKFISSGTVLPKSAKPEFKLRGLWRKIFLKIK